MRAWRLSGLSHRWVIRLGAAMLALIAELEPLLACSVCYGQSNAPIIKGAELSVLFLGGLIYALIGGGALTFFLYRRRLKRAADDESRPLADHSS